MADVSDNQSEDRFADFSERIAAHARQLFRAIQAQDSKAIEVTMFYFQGFLVKVLGSHLRDDPRWDSNNRWLEILDVKAPEIDLPGRLRFRDQLDWVTRDQEQWYTEPFEFVLELFSANGAFHSYTFRFGDHRPLAEKELLSPSTCSTLAGPGDKGWAFVFHYMKEKKVKMDEEKGTSTSKRCQEPFFGEEIA